MVKRSLSPVVGDIRQSGKTPIEKPDASNMSGFFDDRGLFDYLSNTVLPVLIRHSPRIYIWSAACGDGAEPYSIALLLEELDSYHRHCILATEADGGLLRRGQRGGPYLPEQVKNISSALLDSYFTETGSGYWLGNRIKRRVEFRRHDLFLDPFERGYDLIMCRNPGLSLSDYESECLLRDFYFSLREGGMLFIRGNGALLPVKIPGFIRISDSFYCRLPRNFIERPVILERTPGVTG